MLKDLLHNFAMLWPFLLFAIVVLDGWLNMARRSLIKRRIGLLNKRMDLLSKRMDIMKRRMDIMKRRLDEIESYDPDELLQ
jgi:hypothetical protein